MIKSNNLLAEFEPEFNAELVLVFEALDLLGNQITDNPQTPLSEIPNHLCENWGAITQIWDKWAGKDEQYTKRLCAACGWDVQNMKIQNLNAQIVEGVFLGYPTTLFKSALIANGLDAYNQAVRALQYTSMIWSDTHKTIFGQDAKTAVLAVSQQLARATGHMVAAYGFFPPNN